MRSLLSWVALYLIIFVNCDNVEILLHEVNDDNIPSYERQALYDLYNSTNGYDWIYQEGDNGHWNFTEYPNVYPCLVSNPWQGLNCTIPTSSSYYYISEIKLSFNNLNGYVPDSIGNFSHLQYLDLSHNYLNQSIPNTIGNLSELLVLDLSYNSLSGSLPNSIYTLSALQFLNLDSNYYLQGTISELIGQLLQLQYCNLRYNLFTGSIPSTIGNLSETIRYLRISLNQFTGTIPNSIGKLKYLDVLTMSRNQLTGIIPDQIGELSSLSYLNFGVNQLSGTIPSSLSKLTDLISFHLYGNQLVGSIPDWIGGLSLLTYLNLGTNKLSGTIPTSMSKLSNLERLYLFENFLIGSISNLFGTLHNLIKIQLYDNYFTGTLPDSFSQLQNLSFLFVQTNHFSGSLDKAFNSINQKQLSNIQLSNNQFTGNLPEQVFLSHSLITFSAVSNCFHGSIPSSICDNTKLVFLALDGLACASSCQNKIIPSISDAYISENEITGGIPKCLLSMPYLKVLHLSGNSLTGSLPDNIKVGNSLKDLSLAYNVLTGRIPSSIQEKTWDSLDFSHNRISGIISSYTSQYKNASLSLRNNRLSGRISNSLQNMRNISILAGNYYECKYDRSDLPTHDDHRDNYECGSNTFNILYYIWLGAAFILCSCAIFIFYHRNQKDEYIQVLIFARNIWKWIHIIEYMKLHYEIENNHQPIPEKFIYFKAYNTIHEIISRSSLYSTLFIITILLPVYFVLSSYYSTVTYVYAWTGSILYLSGSIAFGIIVSLLIVFVIMNLFIFYNSIQHSTYKQTLIDISEQYHRNIKASYQINDILYNHQRWKIYSMYVIYITINIVIVGGANIAYVYVVLYQTNAIITLCQILLSIFQTIWNNFISPKMINWIIGYLSVQNTTGTVVRRRLFILKFIVSIFNNIIILCFIIAIISPNCFYYVFQQESDHTSVFNYEKCFLFNQNGDCAVYDIATSPISYSPPFTYSYQCSSDFVTYYAPVFVQMCFISTFIVPLIQLSLFQISLQYPLLSKYIKLNKLYYLEYSEPLSPILDTIDIYELLVSMLTLVGLLLTFGVVFPPLAIAFLIAIFRHIYTEKAIVGRYLSHAIKQKAYSCLHIIEEDCKVIPLLSTLQVCGWILLSVSCMFYTLFVFDILGDEVGASKAYWVLIVVPCIPICIYTIYRLYNYRLFSLNKKDIKSDNIQNDSMDGIELSAIATESNPLFVTDKINDAININNNNNNNNNLCDSTNNNNNLRDSTNNNNNLRDSTTNNNNLRDSTTVIMIDDIYEDREVNSIYYQRDNKFEYNNE